MDDLLLELFPDALLNHLPWQDDTFFTVPYKNNYIHIPLSSISTRERKLITELITPGTSYLTQPENRWAHFLFKDSTHFPTDYDSVQLLQVSMKFTNSVTLDRTLWLEAFKSSIHFIVDGFFISDKDAVLIVYNPSKLQLREEIESILTVLNDDFGIQSSLYLGHIWPVNERLPHLFLEEQEIFKDTRSQTQYDQITTLSQAALSHYSFEATSKSPILASIKETILAIPGGADLVFSMWQNLGNVSQAAASLYVHRNTLQYRIERFMEIVDLNLKDMDDLLLSYLALHSRFGS